MYYFFALLITGGVVILTDILSKIFTDGVSIIVIPGFIDFVSAHNSGAGWSILSGAMWLFIPLGILAVIGIIVFDLFYNNKLKGKVYFLGLGLLLGGIVGNLIDRIAFGYVRDFLKFTFFDFPTFNVADIALTFGVILIAVYMLFLQEKNKKEGDKTFLKIKENWHIKKPPLQKRDVQ